MELAWIGSVQTEKGKTMEIVKEMPVPIYEVECYECHSVIRYKRSDVHLCSIICPVCGVLLNATAAFPVNEERREDDAAD